VNEQFLKEFFSMANKEENIEKLIKLIDNESLVNDQLYRSHMMKISSNLQLGYPSLKH